MAKQYCHKELTNEELKNIMACMKTVSALSATDTVSYETFMLWLYGGGPEDIMK